MRYQCQDRTCNQTTNSGSLAPDVWSWWFGVIVNHTSSPLSLCLIDYSKGILLKSTCMYCGMWWLFMHLCSALYYHRLILPQVQLRCFLLDICLLSPSHMQHSYDKAGVMQPDYVLQHNTQHIISQKTPHLILLTVEVSRQTLGQPIGLVVCLGVIKHKKIDLGSSC